MASNTYNTHIYGLRFFYCTTLHQPLYKLYLPTTKISYKLPDILSIQEVQRIIKGTSNIKHRALLTTIYGAGLRVSEALKLKINDIDSDRMTLHIRMTKNRKDRYVPLATNVLKILRKYWRACKFEDYIFPGQKRGRSLSTRGASKIFKSAKKEAGIHKDGGIHSLRHAFATHLLESGIDIFIIKELLGHSSITSTLRYLEFIPNRHENFQSPVDRLDI